MAPVRKRVLSVLIAVFIMLVAFVQQTHTLGDKLLNGELPNPDSYYNIVTLMDGWANGDFPFVARDGVPRGSWVHWTRPYSWTLWQLHYPYQWAGVPLRESLLYAGATLTMLSLLLLVLFTALAVLGTGARRAAMVSGLMLATSVPLLSYGRADQVTHHVFMLVPLAIGAACLLRCAEQQREWSDVMGGLALALAWWISPEPMPFVVGLIYIRIVMRVQHPKEGHSLWPIALGLFGLTLVAVIVDPPPPTFSAWALDRISHAYLLLATLLGSMLLLGEHLARRRTLLPSAIVVIGAASIGAGLIWLFAVPGARSGPSGLIPAEMKALWWDHISELQPVSTPADWVAWFGLPLLAAAVAGFVAWRDRSLWLLGLAGMALAYGLLGAWHTRMGAAAALAATLAVCIAAGRLRAFGEDDQGIPLREQLGAFVLTLAGPLLLCTFAGLNYLSPPSEPKLNEHCDLGGVADALQTIPPATMLTGIFSAPDLLYRTRHRTIAGPYHHNVEGVLDNYHAWLDSGTEAPIAHGIVMRRRIEYLLACTYIQENLVGDHGHRTLAQRASDGDVPAWLKPVPWPANTHSNWRLYRVDPLPSSVTASEAP